MRINTKTLCVGLLALVGASGSALGGIAVDSQGAQRPPRSLAEGIHSRALARDTLSDWILRTSDNICGLRDKRMLSNPAKVDWPTLMAETPEMKEIADKGIDPSSPRGIQLRQQATERLTNACEAEREAAGNCSVWKRIAHKDGRVIADITAGVRARL